MIAIAVDDEILMLNELAEAVNASPDIDAVTEFTSCSAAIEWAANNKADIAFLDISMRGMGGLALAEKLLEMQPKIKIIFCTGHSEYAVDAFRIHVSGYLMKPITPEAVQREIDCIKPKGTKKLLTIRCFGTFEVFADGVPLVFKRSIAKEILAVLTDRCGAGVTSKQICALIRPENPDDDNKNMNYIRQGFKELRSALDSVGAASVLVRSGIHNYSLNADLVNCDYYSFMQRGKPAFRGEYMKQYSWAEETCALLWEQKIGR